MQRTKDAIWHAHPKKYEDVYWIATMKHAYKKKWDRCCYYKIVNVKARNALRCSFCKKHPVAALYDKLELYCEDHMPEIIREKVGADLPFNY